MNAGKDVYLEKPMIQRVEEGAAIIEAADKTKRILQIGSQRVSSVIYQKARQIYRVRRDRPVEHGRGLHGPQLRDGRVAVHDPARRTPQNIDWDRFLGHAPKRPFEPIRLFRWRN